MRQHLPLEGSSAFPSFRLDGDFLLSAGRRAERAYPKTKNLAFFLFTELDLFISYILDNTI